MGVRPGPLKWRSSAVEHPPPPGVPGKGTSPARRSIAECCFFGEPERILAGVSAFPGRQAQVEHVEAGQLTLDDPALVPP